MMSCDFAHFALHSYFDGELSVVHAAEFEHHLAYCSDCNDELAALNLVRGSLRRALLYEPAPASLARKIRADLYSVSLKTSSSLHQAWRVLVAAASLLLVLLILWRVIPMAHREEDYQAEVAAIVDAHVHSLLPGQATDMDSKEPQMVRAWLESKVKFAVPVRDLTNVGFTLEGARADIVKGRTVAALVYRGGDQLFNVFIWRTSESDGPSRAGSRQGHQWIAWRKDKLEFCTVSDAASADLGRLHRLLTE